MDGLTGKTKPQCLPLISLNIGYGKIRRWRHVEKASEPVPAGGDE
jgi:hypothetical protein